MNEPVFWMSDGSPHSSRFNDVYHSRSGGLAQAVGVFLAGCDLPQRCECLHFVSVEAYPVAAADIVRSAQMPNPAREADVHLLARVPVLAQELVTAWQDVSPGMHRFHFAAGRVQLTLAVGEVEPMLQSLVCQADAVYLDGFNPALNPEMWSSATLQAVALHCRAGTTLATYSVARSVCDGLRQLGFRVEKCPGLPPKRERLQAVFCPPGAQGQ